MSDNMIPRGYEDLPMIKMVETPFETKGTDSYGMICYAKDTEKWLMVQRKHSIGIICLLKSFYMRVDIPEHVQNMTWYERGRIREAVTSLDLFHALVFDTLGHSMDNYILSSWQRLRENSEIILKALDKYNDSAPELTWEWPKGQREKLASGLENPRDTAMRELIEETGMGVIRCPYVISGESITQSLVTNMGYRYTSTYWVCVLDNMIQVPPVSERNREVNNCIWIDTNNVEERLTEIYSKTFSHAKRIVSTILYSSPRSSSPPESEISNSSH